MLNHKTIFKQKSKSKSKIFITILCIFGLLFSWSCSCKNRVSDPNETPINGGITNKKPDETPPGTFSMSAATDNVTDNFVVKSASTVGEIKIAFVSANNYDYTLSYEVVDNDSTEANRITTAETTYANNVLTIKDTAVAKVRNLDSSGGPAEKTITINFTFKANDTSLKNNTQTLSVEVKLTHAQKIEDSNIDNVITKILNGISGNAKTFIERGEVPNKTYAEFIYNAGTYTTGVYKLKNEETSNPIEQFDADNEKNFSDIKTVLDYYLPQIVEIKSVSQSAKEAEGGVGQSFYKVYYDITWDDKYELSVTEIAFQFDLK